MKRFESVLMKAGALLGALLCARPAVAGPEFCNNNGGPTLCVRFDNDAGAPEPLVHFAFDFSNPQAPSVELRVGQTAGGGLYQWRVWSKDAQGAPANIGSITSPGAYNYSVKIANPTDGPGAANMNAVTLTPPGDHRSSLEPGSRISGDLTGNLVVQKDSTGVGGFGAISIEGNVGGEVIIPGASPGGTFGSVSGSVEVGSLFGEIGISGTLSGTVAIDAIFDTGQQIPHGFSVGGDVTATASITIGDMVGGIEVSFGQAVIAGGGTPNDFGGDLVLQSGIKENQTVTFNSRLTSTGSIDLNNQGIAGTIDQAPPFLLNYAGSGSILNGGPLRSGAHIWLSGAGLPFTGSVTFSEVQADATIDTESGDWGGTLTILGDVRGVFTLRTGNLLPDGRISVLGGILGSGAQVQVWDGFGTIEVGGDIEGSILVSGQLDGSVVVSGDLLPDSVFGYALSVGGNVGFSGSIQVLFGAVGGGSALGNIEIRGNMGGNVFLMDKLVGAIHVNGDISRVLVVDGGVTAGGEILADADGIDGGSISGLVGTSGINDGNICGDNLSPTAPLPHNIQIAQFGPNATICGELVCGNAAQADPGVSKNRAVSFFLFRLRSRRQAPRRPSA